MLDGGKGINKAVCDLFAAEGLIQRCQTHKRRNVKSHLPEEYQAVVDRQIKAAYNMSQYNDAKSAA